MSDMITMTSRRVPLSCTYSPAVCRLASRSVLCRPDPELQPIVDQARRRLAALQAKAG